MVAVPVGFMESLGYEFKIKNGRVRWECLSCHELWTNQKLNIKCSSSYDKAYKGSSDIWQCNKSIECKVKVLHRSTVLEGYIIVAKPHYNIAKSMGLDVTVKDTKVMYTRSYNEQTKKYDTKTFTEPYTYMKEEDYARLELLIGLPFKKDSRLRCFEAILKNPETFAACKSIIATATKRWGNQHKYMNHGMLVKAIETCCKVDSSKYSWP